MNILVGIAGTFASGKDTIAKKLVDEHGFTHVSTGDLVREVAMRERGSIERPVLKEVATAHRQSDGAGYFVEQGLDKPRPLVISGIRSLGEAKALKNAGGILLYIDAPIEVRYQRMQSRLRDGEAQLTLEEFRDGEEKEMYGGPTDADFNLRGIRDMADTVIDNEYSLDEFTQTVYRALGLAS